MLTKIERILICDKTDPVCRQILTNAGLLVEEKLGLSKAQLCSVIGEYDAVVVRSSTTITREVLESGARLKLVARAGTGVDNIDVVAASERRVAVMNTPLANCLSAAEHTCALLLALCRHVPQACADLKAGNWNPKLFLGSEVASKTLGILGLGRVGQLVAQRMQAFGMTAIAFDPIVPPDQAARMNVALTDLDELFARADFITVHTPLIPQTANLLNADAFAKCRRGFRLVNCARGGIVNERDLLDALNSGQCGGAALDVFDEEPLTDAELARHPRVICTPHLGASTAEGQLRVAQDVANQIVAARTGTYAGIINPQVVA